MTWSILARDGQGRFGVAIASRFFAVGALCVHSRRGVGVLATQALMNPLYGPAGLALLAEGRSAAEVVAMLTAGDAGRQHRQLQLLPATGPAAAHTGSQCIGWCGQLLFDDFSVAGNLLAGPQVIAATAQAFQASAGQPLAERLLAAMAAALRIHGDEDWPQLDLRVDDHAEPIAELQRLYRVSLDRYQPFTACLAGRHDPVGLTDRSAIEARIASFQAARAGSPT